LISSTAIGRLSVAAFVTAMLAFAGCGGDDGGGTGDGAGDGAGAGASDQIESSITQFVKGRDCSVATEEFRKELTGETGVKTCSHRLSLREKVKDLSIDKVTTSGTTATADVTTDGEKVPLRLVQQGDKWLIANSGK
jgi:hypothetical protein